MRGREFTMKDAYSFDRNAEAAVKSYEAMYTAYCRIFERLGLTYRAVRPTPAPSAARCRTSSRSSPTPVKTRSCTARTSDYAANIELAEALPLIASAARPRRR